MARRSITLILSALLVSWLLPGTASAAAPATLDAARLDPTGGSAETLLHVPAVGRYSVTAESAAGAALEIVDRMAGTIAAVQPETPSSDASGLMARADLWLDQGDYKVRVRPIRNESVRLRVQRFELGNADADAIPLLPDGTTSRGDLHDLEIFSYWIVIDARTPTLLLEARGRTLKSLTLWRDGTWDTGARPASSVLEVEQGKPLTVLELNLDLEPGSYLVQCAGGTPREWAKDSPERPFSITRGARFLGETGRMSVTLPPERTLSFLVAGTVDSVEMSVPGADDYRLETSSCQQGRSRHGNARSATINPKSSSLRCSVRGSTGGGQVWVTVQGPAGRSVDVEWMDTSLSGPVVEPFRESGSYLTSVLSSLEGDDSVDATGLILQVDHGASSRGLTTQALQAVTFSPEQPLRRSVNCIGQLSFVAQPLKRGTYSIAEKDRDSASALYTFALLDDQFSSGSDAQPVQVKGGGRIDLQEKLYLVTITPVKAGILDFAIVPSNLIGKPKTGGIFAGTAPAPRNDFCWASTMIAQSGNTRSYLVLGQRQGVLLGVSVRRLPVDLRQPAALRVEPGTTINIPFDAREDLLIASTHPGFTSSTAIIDGIPWRPDRVIPKGPRTLTITNRTSSPQWHVLSAVPPDPTATAARPTVPAPETVFPSLTEGTVAWRSIARSQSASYLLKVDEPGSYRVTTSGRLALGISIRTPLNPLLVSSSGYVDGRNAELTAYLRRGTYLVQVSTQGDSEGRAGIQLRRMRVAPYGTVRDGDVLRATVAGGQLMRADLVVEQGGDYVVDCLGLGHDFPWRFEDADGWPIGAPIRSGTLSQGLAPGLYHYISLAHGETTRRVLSVRLVRPTPTIDPGAKQAALILNQATGRIWMEREGRPADVLTFTLPAPINATFTLSPGMLYRIVGADGGVLSEGVGGRPVPLALHAGAWRIEATSLQENNQKRYDVSLMTPDFLVGSARQVRGAHAEIPVSIGAAGTVEIWSSGRNELDAVLTDAHGTVIARGETIADDWNFRILAAVSPGRYVLRTDSPLSRSSDSLGSDTVIRMVARQEKTLPAATGSLSASLTLAGEIAVVPFVAREEGVYRVSCEAVSPAAAAVVHDGVTVAAGSGPVLVALERDARYTLRFWRMSDAPAQVTLRAAMEKAADTARDGTVTVAGAALHVQLPAGTSFHLESSAGPLLFAPAAGAPFEPVGDSAVSTAAGSGWAVRPDGSALGACRIATLELSPGDSAGIRTGSAPGGFLVSVPPRSIALVSTENDGRPVGLSAGAASGGKPEVFDWRGASVGNRESLLGLRDGSFRARVWDADAGSRESRRVGVMVEVLPVSTELPLGTTGRSLSVPPRSAVSLTGTRGFVEVSLEQGMAAFSWAGSPAGMVSAREAPGSGVLDAAGGSIVVVNRSAATLLCALKPAAVGRALSLGDGPGYEFVAAGESALSFDVRSGRAGQRLYLWGAVARARFAGQEDGRLSEGDRIDSDIGPILSFPAQKGRLDLDVFAGPVRAWLSVPDSMLAGFVSRDPLARQAALPPEGGTLQPSPQAWSFSVDAESIVSLRAEGNGVLGLYDRNGACLRAAAGTMDRSLLVMLPRGSYTALTRPLAGAGAAGGLLTLRALASASIDADGEGDAVLIGPHEQALYRFTVKAAGRVGCGIRAQNDTLSATLFDARFTPMGTGRIFIRSLEPGTYYLLVSSGGAPQRYAPVVYGLAGERTDVPDSIVKSYRGE